MKKLISDITIGSYRFSGVHEVQVRRSLHTFVDTAKIVIPSKAVIIKKDGKMEEVITGEVLKDEQQVTIRLGYDDELHTEFEGYVKRRNLNMPLEIECEGYSWLLRRNKVKGFWKEISVKDLLAKVVAGTDITVQCEQEVMLTNVTAIDAPGTDVLNFITRATEGSVSIFFISPKVLWAGLAYTQTGTGTNVFGLGEVKYRLGYNCIKDNGIKERTIGDNPVLVNFLKRTPEGTIFSDVSSETAALARKYKKVLNHIKPAFLKALAQEKQDRVNYLGYEGHLNGFLHPFCLPGYKVFITDSRYPELDGDYLCEETEVTFGMSGARRKITIGPKIGWKNG